ncbi:hypothetical protein ASG01_06685 [Chryseobacterium sp. Leaf180]|jgi:hypothetical protein|uniref:hypothetical protein n=1 Tax=Chryseobacterium sp. Leaf180 TaxID=1736289 RepID=UPI0006F9851A|nr:hypothetical protein [Chryseobacterium sp. Leaf180]KQR95521.1 hypothetical protein ASG01_06685 [Chryseobacterium sp. Leaf180]
MKTLSKFLLVLILGIAVFSCKQNEQNTVSDLDKLRNSNNRKSYPAVQMDSAQAINSITKQKIQELLDLSTLYNSGYKNTEIDTLIYSQMQSYFQKPDSATFNKLFRELDSLKVKTVKVGKVSVRQEIQNQDTLDFAKFDVEYFDQKHRSIGSYEKNAQYTLVSKPIKFKKEFKFYFTNFYSAPFKKDSTAVGVTR